MTRGIRSLAAAARWTVVVAGVAVLSGRAQAQISPGPLARAHRSLEGASQCVKCHGLNREPMATMCVACHKEIGALQRDGRGYHARPVKATGKTCAQCHPDHAGADFEMIEWPDGSAARFDHARAGWTLEGAHREAKCTACHATKYRTEPVAALSPRRTGAGWIGLGTTCVGCHEVDDVHKGALKGRCEDCHDAREWAPARGFDHDESSYPLTGKHRDVACDKCHATPRLPVQLNAEGKRVGFFKPVPFRECTSCHTDPHRGSLGARCASCHVTRGFDEIDRKGFNHEATKYPLRGRHRVVGCDGCHGANLATRHPPSGTCATCHQDPHDASPTRGDCATCHSVSGFAPSSFSVAMHAKTAYALDGKHLAVKCVACHVPPAPVRAAPRGGPKPVARLSLGRPACASCHVDAHGRELAALVTTATCETCHSTQGFLPSTFSVAAHGTLRVTLEGRHGAVPCASCHGPQRPGLPPLAVPPGRTARTTLKVPEVACASCHVDPHGGRFDATVSGGCRTCHGQAAWQPATTSVATHAALGWPLDGGHRAVPCVDCHAELGGAAATSTLRLAAKGVRPLPFGAKRATSCVSCHATPHGDQFAHRKDGGACEGCHTVATFAPARFDHERESSFSLAGAHVKVACASCHRPSKPGGMVVYRPLSGKCESCHAGSVGGAS